MTREPLVYSYWQLHQPLKARGNLEVEVSLPRVGKHFCSLLFLCGYCVKHGSGAVGLSSVFRQTTSRCSRGKSKGDFTEIRDPNKNWREPDRFYIHGFLQLTGVFLIHSLLCFLGFHLQVRKAHLEIKILWHTGAFGTMQVFVRLVIARACGDGLKYAAKVFRIGNESLLPLTFVNLKLYLPFALFLSCISCSTCRATCLLCPKELKQTKKFAER